MAADEKRCERCPLYNDEPRDGGIGRLCAGLVEYPVWISEGSVSVKVSNEDKLAEACSEWTREAFATILQRPGVDIHPRALLRFKLRENDPRPRSLCPHSWPAPSWVRMVLEQVVMDQSGMQVRYLYNNKPWVSQPAIYTDCFQRVQQARAIFEEWNEGRKANESSGTGPKHRSDSGGSRRRAGSST